MAERGLHLYYHKIRTVFKDEGTRWRENWEPLIRTWIRKARIWDTFSHIFDKDILSASKYFKDLRIPLDDYKLVEILEKIRKAFQAQKELTELQNWLLLNAKIKYPPKVAEFIENSLSEWKMSKGEGISTPFFEVAPKGTMEQLKEVEHALQFIESTNPIGKIDGLPVHNSEVLEYVRLWLRSILGLPTEPKNLWSVRDVRRIYSWAGMGRKLRREDNTEQTRLSCAPDSLLTDPHAP